MEWVVPAGAGVSLIGLVAFRSWRLTRMRTRSAVRAADGAQEATIVVERGYTPSRIELEAGVPTRLRFERLEADPRTEPLVCELLPSQHRLAALGETVVSFTPQRPGRFAFTCGMGMYFGTLVVRPTSQRTLRARPSGSQWPGPASASDQREGRP